METKLKKGAFGYNSKEVEAYLLEISGKYLNDVKAKDELIDTLNEKVDALSEREKDLEKEIKTLSDENADLKERLDAYEAERLSVADALVKAQREAQDILSAAREEAEAEKAKAQAEHAEYLKKIDDAKSVLCDMKNGALKLIDEYKDCVEKFTDFKAACHDD